MGGDLLTMLLMLVPYAHSYQGLTSCKPLELAICEQGSFFRSTFISIAGLYYYLIYLLVHIFIYPLYLFCSPVN